jgi:hypothetical protein
MTTTIRMLLPKDCKPGHCAVCGVPAILKWRDTELGAVGDCCYGVAVQADKVLQAANFRRPEDNFMKNNPFAAKGYVEKNGVLTKDGITDPGSLLAEVVAAFVCKPYMSIADCTDEQKLNRTEKAYLARLRSLFSYVGVQNITLKLGDDCRYTPDFNVIDETGRFVFHEVKGFMREDALVKLKVAARQFRMFHFVLARKHGAGWDITEIKP